jgi:hemolysin activation/secretion protein
VGAVAFADLGRAWGGEGNQDNSHLSGVGVGLRFTSSKARIGNLLHIDVAAPTGTRQGLKSFYWIIKGETVF